VGGWYTQGELKEFDLRCRVSRFGKHIEKEGTSTAKLRLRMKYVHPERWWVMQVRVAMRIEHVSHHA
jgi:hypothetical protein